MMAEVKGDKMNIGVAVNKKSGLKDKIAEHFGQAKYFLIYDTEVKKFVVEFNPEYLKKPELPPDLLNRRNVNVVIAFSLGIKAYEKFKKYNIKMYKATEKSILENINDLINNNLRKLSGEDLY